MTDEEMADKYVTDTGNNDCTIEAYIVMKEIVCIVWVVMTEIQVN